MSDEQITPAGSAEAPGEVLTEGTYAVAAGNRFPRSAQTSGSETGEATDLGLIPATEVKPEDIGTLSLRYVDGVAQLVVSDGTAIPAALAMVSGSGDVVATYEASERISSRSYISLNVCIVGNVDSGK